MLDVSQTSAKEASSCGTLVMICNISGVDSDDTAIATLGHVSFSCFTLTSAIPDTNRFILHMTNYSDNPQNIGSTTAPIGIVVFDKQSILGKLNAAGAG